jgi:hypothetical protein
MKLYFSRRILEEISNIKFGGDTSERGNLFHGAYG